MVIYASPNKRAALTLMISWSYSSLIAIFIFGGYFAFGKGRELFAIFGGKILIQRRDNWRACHVVQ
jgi:hypothetical protein